MIAQGWYTGVAACTCVNASGSRNTPCKLQRASSDQCTSSGVTVSVSDHAKFTSRAACMHMRFQRCSWSQPSIIQQASTLGFIRSDFPCVFVSCLLDRKSKSRSVGTVWNSTVDFFCWEIFGFWLKPFLFHKQSYMLRFSIVQVGWLVGCDLVPLLGMYVSTTF